MGGVGTRVWLGDVGTGNWMGVVGTKVWVGAAGAGTGTRLGLWSGGLEEAVMGDKVLPASEGDTAVGLLAGSTVRGRLRVSGPLAFLLSGEGAVGVGGPDEPSKLMILIDGSPVLTLGLGRGLELPVLMNGEHGAMSSFVGDVLPRGRVS